MAVRNGLDRFAGDFKEKFDGFRLGLVANSASLSADGKRAWDVLIEAGFDLVCLYAPEHGTLLQHQEGIRFANYEDKETGLPVRSLYDEERRIDSSRFKDVDLILYDLPNVGCRFYTYVQTLVELLRHSHRSGLPIMVLDRPNPIRADIVEGPIAKEEITSPFGPDKVPVRYGMTMAEFARAYVSRHKLATKLSVMLMDGYKRDMWFDETGLPFEATSPNLRSLDAITMYPGTCLLEGTTLSEGRGTDNPFEIFGAPWLDTSKLLERIDEFGFTNVSFEECTFTPTRSKLEGVECAGLRLKVEERDSLRPVSVMLSVIAQIRLLHPEQDFWLKYENQAHPFFDLLLCDSSIRQAIENGENINQYIVRYEEAADRFASERNAFLAYKE